MRAQVVVDSDPLSKALTEEEREAYWDRVKRSLRAVLGVDRESAEKMQEEYRGVVEKSPLLEQIAVFHTEPIYIATDLVRRKHGDHRKDWPANLTDDEIEELYRQLLVQVDVPSS